MTIQELFEKTVENGASDLHLQAAVPPVLRIDGRLMLISSYPSLSSHDIEELAFSIMTPQQKEILISARSIDFSYGYGGGSYGDKGRFRINLFYQRNTLAGAFRLLPPTVKSVDELKLPKICHSFAELKQGLILVTGPTGHGKSTTMAAIINEINMKRAANIITIEDPIEYVYPPGKSIVAQRELGIDTHNWGDALRGVLREDPDVVLVGEMRDPESISSAITVAETGHLVFSTLHTNSASQSIDRVIDSFPEHQQNQVRAQLAESLAAVISQRLLPRIDGGRVVATEILLNSNAVKANIREGKTHLIDSTLQNSQQTGMIPLEVSLANLVREGVITLDIAKAYALREEALSRLIS